MSRRSSSGSILAPRWKAHRNPRLFRSDPNRRPYREIYVSARLCIECSPRMRRRPGYGRVLLEAGGQENHDTCEPSRYRHTVALAEIRQSLSSEAWALGGGDLSLAIPPTRADLRARGNRQ